MTSPDLLPVLTLYCDGGTIGHNGHADGTYCSVYDDNLHRTILDRKGSLVYKTSPQAEYCAVLEALSYARKDHTPKIVIIRSDSQLTVNQLNHTYKVSNPILKSLYNRVRSEVTAMIQDGYQVHFEWHPRSELYSRLGH